MVTQAQASAFASFQLATLAQKKRCLGTAPQSLGVFVRCRLRRPLGATGTLNYKYEGGDPQPLPSYL